MRRLLLALMLAASLVGAQDGSFVGPPPPEQCVSKGGHIRWTGVLGDRRLKHPNDVYALAVTERAVVVGGAFEAIKIWDLESGKEIRTLEGHANGTAALAVSRDGNRLYSLGMDQIVKIWDPRSGKLLRTLVGTERKQSVFEWRPGGAMVLAPDESYLVTGSQERAVRLCDVATGKVRHLGGREADVESLAVDREGRWIAYADGDGLSVRILDRLSGDLVRTLTPATSAALGRFERGIRSVAFSPDGRWLVSGRVDGTLHVWDVRSGEELRALTGHESVVGAVAFNGDGTRMVSADWDGVLRVWDTERWESIRTARAGNWIRAVAVSPDGSRFASGGLAGVVRVWNWEGDLLCPTGKGHIAPITSLAVSADGKVIYSASRDETIAIWDTGSGNRTAVVDVAPYKIGHIECTALSADGRLLATGA